MTASGNTLSESASKALLREFGVPMAPEREVGDAAAAAAAAADLGFPVVVKLCGDAIAHKTERGLVKLRLGDAAAVETAGAELLGKATADDGDVTLLVAPMISGNRELIAGIVRDPQFGANVMLGVGGVLAEAVADVQFRPVPISEVDAYEMIEGLATQKLLGAFRGEAAVDAPALAAVLVGLSALAAARPDIVSVDVNPLIVRADGTPVAVDALVELGAPAAAARRPSRPSQRRAVPCPVRPQGCAHRGRQQPPRQVRVRQPPQRAGQRVTPEACTARTCRARRCSASARWPTSPSCPTVPSTSCSCALRPAPTPVCSAPAPPRV